jgi:MFS family permease
VAVIVCLLAMRVSRRKLPSHDSPWSHLTEGFRYAYRHNVVRPLLLMMAATTIAGMPALVLMPFFADEIFQKGSQGLGALMGAMGIGAVVGTLVLARRGETVGLPRVILFSAVTMGVCFIAFAFSPVFELSLAIMPVIGFSVMRQMASANTMIQSSIPDRYRGRIMAMYSMTVVGLGPFGSLAAGAMAHSQGPRLTVCAGGLLALAASAVFAMKMKTPTVAVATEHS